jgi:hypothetical protein
MAYDPEPWHDFAVMLGGASAALAGLVFLGLSLHAAAVAADDLHRTRARNLTAGILSVTIVCALILVPGQGHRWLGGEVVVVGCLLTALFATPLLRFGDRVTGELRVRMLVALAACLLTVAAGASLAAHVGAGLYLLVPAAAVGLAMNVFGAWSLLVGLARR